MLIFRLCLVLSLWATLTLAQDSLSLPMAVHIGLERNESIHASAAEMSAANARTHEAKAGYLPKVNYIGVRDSKR